MVDKSAITGLIADAHLYKKVGTLATKAELKTDQEKIAKLKTCDLNYLLGKNFFGDDGSQIFIYQPTFNTLELKSDKSTDCYWLEIKRSI